MVGGGCRAGWKPWKTKLVRNMGPDVKGLVCPAKEFALYPVDSQSPVDDFMQGNVMFIFIIRKIILADGLEW